MDTTRGNRWIILAGFIPIWGGCTHAGTAANSGSGGLIANAEALHPEVAPGTKAMLKLAGVNVPVQVKYVSEGKKLTVLLIAHGEVFERESYEFDAESFRLREAADGNYAPSLELLKFPMHVGDKWTWSGRMETGGISRPTKATVSINNNKLYVGTVGHETVQSTVDLEIFADAGRPPTKRKLTFWFVPNKGLIRREFGTESVREPVTP